MSTLQEKIAVMQAYADGEPIECRRAGEEDKPWHPCGPNWNWHVYDYRVEHRPIVVEYILSVLDTGETFHRGLRAGWSTGNVKLRIEDGKLVSAEVVK